MAIGTSTGRVENLPDSEVRKLRTEFNALVTKFDALCAKLDTDAANSQLDDTDYQSTLADSAGAKKVNP